MTCTRITKIVGLSVLLIIFSLMMGVELNAKEIVLRMGDEFNPDNPICQANKRFTELVTERTGGNVVIKHYASSALGGGRALVEAVLSGGVDLGDTSDAHMSHYTDAVDLLSLPYLFDSSEEVERFRQTDLYKQRVAMMEKAMNIKVLMGYVSCGGPRVLVHLGKKEVRVPQDMEGMKIRTTGAKVEIGYLQAWGGRPTPVDWGEVYIALQQGVVEAAYNQYLLVYSNKFYEVCRAATELGANWFHEWTFMAKRSWDKLSNEDQQIVIKSAVEAEAYGRKLNEEIDRWAKQKLLESKVKVYIPTPAEKMVWKKKAMDSWDQFVGPNTTIPRPLVEKVRELLKK